MILFYDTETTGLVNFKEDYTHPSQPNLVQLGAILCDNNGNELCVIDCLVKPEGWIIPDNMVHGISHKEAEENGLELELVVKMFNELRRFMQKEVCHNLMFDSIIMLAATNKCEDISHVPSMIKFCTMLASVKECGLKQLNSNRPKWPKLSEAYKHYFNEELVDAHDALTDVRATKRIYFEMVKRGLVNNIGV